MVKSTNDVILVNRYDEVVGQCEKLKAHIDGLRHRAFSIVLLRKVGNEIQTLIQKRHPDKYHTGSLWSNSCCSHPIPGESSLQAANRRLKEELGLDLPLQYIDCIDYKVATDDKGYENEIDHLFVGFCDQEKFDFNKSEIVLVKWVEWYDLQTKIKENPAKYTPWLLNVLKQVNVHLNRIFA